MKNLLLACLISILLFTGCTKQNEINVSQIAEGNFPSVAGTYVNPDGEKIQLNANGLRWNERQTGDISCSSNGVCTMGIHVAGQGEGGYSLMIYPEGVEIPGLSTDVNKVRICYGQAEPMSENEIYTFSSNHTEPDHIESDDQAFIMKNYYDVLFELSSPYGLFNPHIESNHLTIHGVDISVEFYDDVSFYTLTLTKNIKYVKGEPKKAEIIVSASCYQDQQLHYNGKVMTNDGQTFFLTYDEINQVILNNNEASETFGQSMNFVDSLHCQIIDIFEDARKIAKSHYPILFTWKEEITEVRNKIKSYEEIKNARDIEPSPQLPEELLSQAFVEKHYYDVLKQCFRNWHHMGDVQISEHSISIRSTDDAVVYQSNGLYTFQTNEFVTYTKNGKEKYGNLSIHAERNNTQTTKYEGSFTPSNEETFHLLYDPVNEILIDNEQGSKTYGQPTKFVSSLNQRLIAAFKNVQTMTELQYSVLSEWQHEIRSVKEGIKTVSDVKDAYKIELNLEILDIEFDESMSDFVMTDPCASAVEIVKCFLYQSQKAISLSNIESPHSDDFIYWDVLRMIGFEGNEHFPYQHLVRRNDNLLFVFTLEDIQQYAYELYQYEFNPYIPGEWSSMYKPALKRYESGLEFGIFVEGPDTFRVENIRTEQKENQIFVYFDVVWFDVDEHWNPAEVTKIQPSVSEFNIMTENGHTFLRHISTVFGQ